MEKGRPEFPQISIFSPVRRCMKPGSLQPGTWKCAFCTDTGITFLGSPFPQLPFDMIIALEQTRYPGKRKTRISLNFNIGPVRRCMKPGSLQPRAGKCAFCTDTRITFLGSPFPQLRSDIVIALVQTRYREEMKPRFPQSSIFGPILCCMKPGSLQLSTWKYAFCTDTEITLLGSPFPQLRFDIVIALVANTVPWGMEAPNFLKFSYSALFCIASKWVVCSPVLESALFAPTQLLFTIIIFLGSPFPQLPFDIIIALVQTRYRGARKPRISSNFHIPPYLALHLTGCLRPRTGKCAFCTDTRITFLGSSLM